jgi:hypothetical protein
MIWDDEERGVGDAEGGELGEDGGAGGAGEGGDIVEGDDEGRGGWRSTTLCHTENRPCISILKKYR